MNYILFDDRKRHLLPFTFNRPVANIRVGILTIKEKWQKYLNSELSVLTDNYLSQKYLVDIKKDNILINATILPDIKLVERIAVLEPGQALVAKDKIIAYYVPTVLADKISMLNIDIIDYEKFEYEENYTCIKNTWDIFLLNSNEIKRDFELICYGRNSHELNDTNRIIGGEKLFVEDGANVLCSIINASEGPVYIGKNATIMEGSVIRGPAAICDNSVIKVGAKIYEGTTIGPYCKVGGEVYNSVFFGYSNKAHDGFFGHSVIGEWCNIGADTNTSNLKNDYSTIKLWDYAEGKFVDTGLQFCGLIMGDHSKSGINVMFNSGTVVGMSSNIFGAGYPRHFVPSFSWGSPIGGFENYLLQKAIKTAELVCARRGIIFNEIDAEIFKYVYNLTYIYRY